MSYKGVDEAVAVAQLYSVLWAELVLPIYAIAWAPCKLPKKLNEGDQRWLSMLMESPQLSVLD